MQRMIKEKDTLFEVISRSIRQSMLDIHTATIAVVTGVQDKTISCKVVIPKVVNGEIIEMPEFIKVPPVFMQGGTSYTAHPISEGDYCLLIFTERCFDAWYAGSDNVQAPEFRMHDYSDGFAIVGVNPLDAAISIPDVITEIGDKYSEGNHEHVGDLSVDGNVSVSGDNSVDGNNEAATYSVGGQDGATGVVTTMNGRVMTFVNGLIVDIV